MTSRLHPVSIHALRALALACLAATCLTGCPVEEPGGADAAPADTFTMLYETLGETCRGCHAEGAIGAPVGTEATQDWSSVDSARSTLQGTASGLMGNFAGCNDVPFLGDTPETSLLVAAFDENVRADFSLAEFPDCNADTISDMTLKIGRPLSAAELSLLRQFVMEQAQ
jgi:cytochrome c5